MLAYELLFGLAMYIRLSLPIIQHICMCIAWFFFVYLFIILSSRWCDSGFSTNYDKAYT